MSDFVKDLDYACDLHLKDSPLQEIPSLQPPSNHNQLTALRELPVSQLHSGLEEHASHTAEEIDITTPLASDRLNLISLKIVDGRFVLCVEHASIPHMAIDQLGEGACVGLPKAPPPVPPVTIEVLVRLHPSTHHGAMSWLNTILTGFTSRWL